MDKEVNKKFCVFFEHACILALNCAYASRHYFVSELVSWIWVSRFCRCFICCSSLHSQ